MSTGYTYPVVEGQVTSFPEFALSCAKAFGACISLREEPFDTPIPEEFKPSTWASENFIRTQKEMQALLSMTSGEVEAAAHAASVERYEGDVNYFKKCSVENARVREMLDHVEKWTPPTPEHGVLKTFMREQLEMSVSDPGPEPEYKELDPAEWLSARMEALGSKLAYYQKQNKTDIENASTRTNWVRDLRDSLK